MKRQRPSEGGKQSTKPSLGDPTRSNQSGSGDFEATPRVTPETTTSITRRRLLKSVGQAVVIAVPTWHTLLIAAPASAVCGQENCNCTFYLGRSCSYVTYTLWDRWDVYDCDTFAYCYTTGTNTYIPCNPS